MCGTDRSKVGLVNKLTSATQLVGEIREHLHMCDAWWIMNQFKIKSYAVCRPIPVGGGEGGDTILHEAHKRTSFIFQK